jgi:hypothetical protein
MFFSFHFSGESAFHSMMKGFAWAKRPMFPRLADLRDTVPMTVIYGGQVSIPQISISAENISV